MRPSPRTFLGLLVAAACLAGCSAPASQQATNDPADTTPGLQDPSYPLTLEEPFADRLRPGSLLDEAARAAIPRAVRLDLSMNGLAFAADGGLDDFSVTFEGHHENGDVTVADYRPVQGEPQRGSYAAWMNTTSSQDYQGPRLTLDSEVVERLDSRTFQELFDAAADHSGPSQFRVLAGATVEEAQDGGYPMIVSNADGLSRASGTFVARYNGTDGSLVGEVQLGDSLYLVRFD